MNPCVATAFLMPKKNVMRVKAMQTIPTHVERIVHGLSAAMACGMIFSVKCAIRGNGIRMMNVIGVGPIACFLHAVMASLIRVNNVMMAIVRISMDAAANVSSPEYGVAME